MVGRRDRFGGEGTVAGLRLDRTGIAAPLIVHPFAFDGNSTACSGWAAYGDWEEINLVAPAGSLLADCVVSPQKVGVISLSSPQKVGVRGLSSPQKTGYVGRVNHFRRNPQVFVEHVRRKCMREALRGSSNGGDSASSCDTRWFPERTANISFGLAFKTAGDH
jgi:hypothetical protein